MTLPLGGVSRLAATGTRANPETTLLVGSGYCGEPAAIVSGKRGATGSEQSRDRPLVRSGPSGHLILLDETTLRELAGDLQTLTRSAVT